MSYFASLVKSGNTANLNQLIIELQDSMPCTYQHTNQTSVINTASSSYVDAMSTTVACNADEIVMAWWSMAVSCGVIGEQLRAGIFINNVEIAGYQYFRGNTANTAGNEGSIAGFGFAENLAGSIDVKIKWRRSGGAGTIYSEHRSLTIVRAKKRA